MSLLNNRYLILNELGRGGFGHTFLAEDTHLPSRRRCVIKQFKPANNDPNLLPHLQERFGREASILERVGEEHSQIPRLYAYFIEDEQFYLVQELIDGQTLAQMVRTGGPLKSEVVKEIVLSLLGILEYLHAHDIIHRDIKPDNIIYRRRDNKPVLIDFGTVKETVTTVYDQGGVPTSMIIGSPGYMPMEQVAGLAVYSSDLYALGWTAIYLLTGKQPQELVDRRTGANHWREFAPGVDYDLATVIDRAVQRASTDRHATAGEMLQALNPVLPKTVPWQTLPGPVPPEPVPPQPYPQPYPPYPIRPFVGERRKSRSALFLAGIVGAALLVALLAVGIYRASKSSASRQTTQADGTTQTPLTGNTGQIATPTPVKQTELRYAWKQTLTGHSAIVRRVEFSPDGKTLASASYDDTIKLWDAETGALKQTLTGPSSDVNAVTFSPDGRTLASAGDDKTVRLWDAQTGVLKQTLTEHTNLVWAVAFSPDGKTLASTGRDKTIKLWDAETGALRQTLTGHEDNIYSIEFSPDGRTLASASSDNTIKLWDAQTGTLKQTLTGHGTFDVDAVTFSPSGRTLASASDDKTVKLWDAGTGTLKQTLTDHTDLVWAVAFSPDGGILASGSSDKTIKLWDAGTGALKQTLTGHEDKVLSVAFSPDGKTLASGSTDKTVRLWRGE